MSSKAIEEKVQGLTGGCKRILKSTVARKYDVPNNTLTTWIMNKDKIMQSYREYGNVKRRGILYSPNVS